MTLQFYKYEGAGNDFVMIDNRDGKLSLSTKEIEALCDRNMGIGGDGLMLIETLQGYDFYMRYYNSDGSEVGMCGNGGRCIALFAHHLGIGGSVKKFKAKDGEHTAEIISADERNGIIKIRLIDIEEINKITTDKFFLNSGVPHYVEFVDDVKKVDVENLGRRIRYSVEGGTNVNFVQIVGDTLIVRTYERGVEGETLACGTGVTAAAVAAHYSRRVSSNNINIIALGGELSVSFDETYRNITLTGGARKIFKGEL